MFYDCIYCSVSESRISFTTVIYNRSWPKEKENIAGLTCNKVLYLMNVKNLPVILNHILYREDYIIITKTLKDQSKVISLHYI